MGGHNLLDGVTVATFGRFGWLWQLLHVPGLISGKSMTPPIILVAYPLLPWVGVMALGYAFGKVSSRRRATNGNVGISVQALPCSLLLLCCGGAICIVIRYPGRPSQRGGEPGCRS